MAIDSHYVLGAPLEEYFVDRDSGLPLAGGTITFYEDLSRVTAKTVYELSGAPPNYTFTPLPNPMTLSSVGTPQNAGGDNVAIYYYPYDSDPDSDTFGDIHLYYVVVKDSNGVEQFVREAWPPNTLSGDGGSDVINATPVQNQISNPQFTRVLINQGDAATTQNSAIQSYAVTGAEQTFAFAPGWDFVIAGTGTVTVQRIALAGSGIAPTNPPYAINVVVPAGITYCRLRQRFNSNSGLWGSTADNDIFLSTMLVASNAGAAAGITMSYQESTGNGPIEIFNELLGAGTGYTQYEGGSAAAIPSSTNSDKGVNGYTDIYISFPTPCNVNISSIQVVPSFNATSAAIVAYDETSANRDQALLGDYYIPRLEAKPVPSLLTAWDFPLNPAQQFGDSVTITGTASYTWDQTIAARATANVAMTRNSITKGASFLQAGNADAFYIQQYLSGTEAKKILGTRLSVNVNAYTSVGAAGTITMRVYLFRGTAAAAFGTGTSSTGALGTPLGTVATSGVFTQTDTTNWVLIPRSGLDTATAILNEIATNDDINDGNNYGFNGWEITSAAQIADTEKFSIVVTFANDTASTVNVTSISLVPGDIPTRPAPSTASEVLSRCQYYYEKSYNLGVLPGTTTAAGSVLSKLQTNFDPASAEAAYFVYRSFGIPYKIPKRSAPTVTIYSNTGTIDNVSRYITANGTTWGAAANVALTNWAQASNGNATTNYQTNSTTIVASGGTNIFSEAYIAFHYLADSRIGIVA